MKTKDYCCKWIDREKINKLDTPIYYLPDNYDMPCFHIYIPEGEYESEEVDLAFYLEIVIDNDDVIQKIIEANDFVRKLTQEARPLTLVEGWGGWNINFDKEISDYPIFQFYEGKV